MDYAYDVFISYKRGRINEQWLNEIFFPFFQNYLNDQLPHEPRIFIDTTGLTPGVDFNNQLFNSLLLSKCLVSIWSPPYFRRSEWCIKEFLTMKFRQEKLKLSSVTIPQTLIWPVVYRETQPLPSFASPLSHLDYSEFNVVGEAFFKSEKFIKFQEKLQKDILSIAEIINNVPAMDNSLDTEEGRKMIIEELNAYFEGNFEEGNPAIQEAITWSIT